MIRSETEVVVFYTHREPVTISGDNAYNVWLYLTTPHELRYSDFEKAISSDMEDTAVLKVA